MLDNTVTAVLCVYKRVEYLERQIQALLEQTHKIDNYIIRMNAPEQADEAVDIISAKLDKDMYTIMFCDKNLWVWSRFYAAFNAKTEYVFVLDDDIIPWNKRVENCIHYQNKMLWAIIWSRWSLFKSRTNRFDRDVITESVNTPKELTRVDISGHSRFFPKRHLPYMFDCLPEVDYPTAWEELWISYRAAKNWVPTYIIPMTTYKETRWNKEPKLWLDNKANYNSEKGKYQEFYLYAIKHWFIPINLQ